MDETGVPLMHTLGYVILVSIVTGIAAWWNGYRAGQRSPRKDLRITPDESDFSVLGIDGEFWVHDRRTHSVSQVKSLDEAVSLTMDFSESKKDPADYYWNYCGELQGLPPNHYESY